MATNHNKRRHDGQQQSSSLTDVSPQQQEQEQEQQRQPQQPSQQTVAATSCAAAPPQKTKQKRTKQQHQQTQHKHQKEHQQQHQQPAGERQPDCTAAAAPGDEEEDAQLRRFFKSWAWKREHRPDKDRFQRPYVHTMTVEPQPPADGSTTAGGQQQQQQQQVSLSIKQQKFSSEGFASTVWDSSIVVTKYLEKLGPDWLRGKRLLDLSAGCGLVGIVAAKLQAIVTLSDLAGNLPLLQHNCKANGVADAAVVVEHRWGEDMSALQPPFDVVVACDVMYVQELVTPLLQSLLSLTDSNTTILIAHGRNRWAEPDFKAAAAQHFSIELVPGCELDAVYQCSDVDVLRLRRLAAE